MTENEINIAIAESCGWKFHDESIERPDGTSIDCEFLTEEGVEKSYPDYCNDLNAMHEAEETLSREQRHDYYQQELHDVVILKRDGLTVGDVWFLQIHAAARQRAEAFLRTAGKWVEESVSA